MASSDVTAHSAAPTAPVRRLSFPTMVAYGFGQIAEALKNAAFGTFLLYYYQQIIGVSGTITGAALALSLLIDACFDPVVGSVSDKIRTRWGRRHPFILGSALPLAAGIYFLFNPPTGLSEVQYFLWLTGFAVITRQALTAYHVPHLALGAEMARDYNQRSTLYSFNILFGALAGSIGTAIAYRAFFPTTAEFNPGLLNPAGYHSFSIAFAVGIVVAIVVCALGTWREIPFLLVRAEDPTTTARGPARPRASLTTLLRQLIAEFGAAFRNRSFKSLFFGTVLATLMLAVEAVFNPYMGVHFWGLTTEQLSLLPIVAVAALFLSMVLIAPVTRWLDKKKTLIFSVIIAVITGNLMVVLRLLEVDWFPANGSPLILPMIAVVTFVGTLMGPLIFASLNSMFADIVDEHELETGQRQEGIVFAARGFATKLTSSLGLVIGGWLLDVIAFPKGAHAGTVHPDVLWNLGLIVGPATSVFVMFGALMFFGYGLDRKRHAAITAELSKRRAAADAAASTP